MRSIVTCLLSLAVAAAVWLGCSHMMSVERAAAAEDERAALAPDAAPTFDAGPYRTPGVPTPPTATPAAPTLHDPIKDPAGAFDDFKAARKIGWPLAVMVALCLAFMVAEEKIPWLKKGRRALYLAALSTALLTACNAGLAGGTWWAMLSVAAGAALAYYQSHRPTAAVLAGIKALDKAEA